MKIQCNYCGNYFDDYLAQCPMCSAPNEGIVRTASDQPLTIEELKAWYEARQLPPYETTRFFIGIDYRQPRAFGIYKDENSGEVIVYKNKNDGSRAVRYQGTDEAYGVNELYQRLKQEIIQQKMHNVKKAQGKSGNSTGGTGSSYEYGDGNYTNKSRPYEYGNGNYAKGNPENSDTRTFEYGDGDYINNEAGNNHSGKKPGSCFLFAIIGIFVLGFLGVIATTLAGFFSSDSSVADSSYPSDGYYSYENTYYYYDGYGYDDLYVFKYESIPGKWDQPVGLDEDPQIFSDKEDCEQYFVSEDWNSSLTCTDIKDSDVYKAYLAPHNISQGYYKTSQGCYYHYGNDYDSDWYYYNGSNWENVSADELPSDLSEPDKTKNFYDTPNWDSSLQATDFEDSSIYQSKYADNNDSNDSFSGHEDDNDYNWDTNDSWDSGDSGDSWDSGGTDYDSEW